MSVEYKVEVNDPKIGWVHVNGAFEFLTYSWFVSLEECLFKFLFNTLF